MDFGTYLNSLDLISLQNLEDKLMKDFEQKLNEQNRQCQKHQRFALDSAHFLTLFHQSSAEIVNDMKMLDVKTRLNLDDADASKIEDTASFNVSIERHNQILSENGLRLLWDSFHQQDFYRSILILSYFQSTDTFNISNDSLQYFQDILTKTALTSLSNLDAINDDVKNDLILVLVAFGNVRDFFQALGSDVLDRIHKLKVITNRFKEFKGRMKVCDDLFKDVESNMFVERLNGNYCEFPELVGLSNKLVIEFEARMAAIDDSLEEILESCCHSVLQNITDFTQADLKDLSEIPTERERCHLLMEAVNIKLQELSTERVSQTLKTEIAALIDRIMKAIQSSMRYDNSIVNMNNSSYAQHLTRNLISQIISFYNIIREESIHESLLLELFSGFRQHVQNKSNIILTIQRNEMGSIDKTREFSIGPRSYLTIHLFNELKNGCLNSLMLSDYDIEVLLNVLKTEIFGPFFMNWYESVKHSYVAIKSDKGELNALFWLSDLMIRADLNCHQQILTDLDIKESEIIQSYPHQQLYFSGLFQSSLDKIKSSKSTSPRLIDLSVKSRSIDLLPHFLFTNKE